MVRVRLKNRGSLLPPLFSLSLTLSVVSSTWTPIQPQWEQDSVLSFTAFDRVFRLVLRETEHLIPNEFTTHHHHPHTSEIVENKIGKNGSDGCHWNGRLEGAPGSRVALSTCPPGIGGAIWNGDDVFYLHSDGSQALISRNTDLRIPDFKCGFNHSTDALLTRSRRGAAQLNVVKHPPSVTNATSRFVEMVIVHDYRQFVKFGRDETKLFERSKQVANIVNALYAPLNIFVVLVGVRVWSQRDEIEVDINAEKTLDNFLRYRMDVLAKSIPNDNAQLVTDLTFEKDVVGKALKGPICTYQYSGGVNKDHHESVAVVAATIAHELGHNFGMEHDDLGSCHCPQSRCIMYPASNTMVPPTAWSSCSMKAIHEAFSQHMDHCLLNIPTKIVGASCGNGIVEEGEECDCGPENFCATKCCNPKTCKLSEGATCGHGECCDLATCKPRRAGVKCRHETGECDLSEHCDGESHFCPTNVFKANGDKCGDGDAYCYMGSCASHNMQCKKLWGQTGHVGHRSCFTVNVNGTQIGNCGYDKIRKGYAKCKQKDIMCGTLHCTYVTERLEFGMLSASKLSRFFLKTDKETHTCRSAMVDLGPTDPDPGQAPDGAACGTNQACLSARCVELAQLASPPCEYSCFGHGICNHLGHCHCDPGYAPPYCNFPGNGGSIDSGPTTNPEGESYTLTIILSVVFLGVTPLVLFFIAWTIFSKKDLISKYRLRRRKLAVKHAARQGPLLNLYDKSQISKPVFTKAPPTNGLHKPDVQPFHQQSPPQQQQSHQQMQQPVLNGVVKMVETTNLDADHQSQIRPARPAPPPPPGKARISNTNVPNTDSGTANNLKRTKSSNNSIRRPSGPPPPKPGPLYENVEALRVQMNNELKTAVNSQSRWLLGENVDPPLEK